MPVAFLGGSIGILNLVLVALVMRRQRYIPAQYTLLMM
jgi:hypothetical protein